MREGRGAWWPSIDDCTDPLARQTQIHLLSRHTGTSDASVAAAAALLFCCFPLGSPSEPLWCCSCFAPMSEFAGRPALPRFALRPRPRPQRTASHTRVLVLVLLPAPPLASFPIPSHPISSPSHSQPSDIAHNMAHPVRVSCHAGDLRSVPPIALPPLAIRESNHSPFFHFLPLVHALPSTRVHAPFERSSGGVPFENQCIRGRGREWATGSHAIPYPFTSRYTSIRPLQPSWALIHASETTDHR